MVMDKEMKSNLHMALGRVSALLKNYHLYFGIFLFKEPSNPGYGSSCTNTSNKNVHLAYCVFPDLGTSCLIVYLQEIAPTTRIAEEINLCILNHVALTEI